MAGGPVNAPPARVEQGPQMPPQPGANRNGVRTYLRARMPTFNFSPNELRTLVRFFMAVSSQQEPYIKPEVAPLTDQEMNLARALFTSPQAPCLKCHLTGNAEHDLTANAPNFLQAGERLQPGWTFRWLLDPQKVIPGTAMPSELFKRDGERWVFNGTLPESFNEYKGDHADLLVRYMLQLTPQEQSRIASGSPPATAGSTPTGGGANASQQSSTSAVGGSSHHQSKARRQQSNARQPAKRKKVSRRAAVLKRTVARPRKTVRAGRSGETAAAAARRVLSGGP